MQRLIPSLLFAIAILSAPVADTFAADPAGLLPAAGSGANPAPGQGSFLVAKRSLQDPGFAETVVYLVAHGEEGSVGLIVNRPSRLDLAETVPDLAQAQIPDYRLYYGGPVELSMVLMLARGETVSEGLIHVSDDVYISSERPVMEDALAAAATAQELRFYLGYSGWSSGQLDFEIARDSWHIVPGDPDVIFAADSASLWQGFIDRLEPAGIQVDARPGAAILAMGD